MAEIIIRSLERDRKKAVKAYGEQEVLTCLSEKTEFSRLCQIYSELQEDIISNRHTEEAKWLKGLIEKTIFSKVMEEHGYTSSGKRIKE
jgi:hypothetical protein